jgi:hypothetical protein
VSSDIRGHVFDAWRNGLYWERPHDLKMLIFALVSVSQNQLGARNPVVGTRRRMSCTKSVQVNDDASNYCCKILLIIKELKCLIGIVVSRKQLDKQKSENIVARDRGGSTRATGFVPNPPKKTLVHSLLRLEISPLFAII